MSGLRTREKVADAVCNPPNQQAEQGFNDQNRTELAIRVATLELRTLNDGLLLPWIAPAIRGLILKPLRDHFCNEMGGRELARATGLADWRHQPSTNAVQELAERNKHYCTGCRKNPNCSYGRVFEPDLRVIDPSLIQRGDSEGVRGISIASAMLYSQSESVTTPPSNLTSIENYQLLAQAGTTLSLRLLALGQAIDFLPTVVQAIDGFGRLHGIGYQAPVHFLVDSRQTVIEDRSICPQSLSVGSSGGVIPEVTIEFLTPLLIKNCIERGRLMPPSFHDLFSNSVRIVIRAIREFAHSEYLLNAQFGDFYEASRQIPCSHHRLVPFYQPSISHRNGKAWHPMGRRRATASASVACELFSTDTRESAARTKKASSYSERPLRGWLGSITYKNIPASYLPWLIHAGHLGIGSDRNRGAGLWRVLIG